MTTDQIRKAFLEYFQSQKHAIVESSSLVPAGDPTLLFTNAGMVQFKDCFLGSDKRSYSRATTCQKCLRISGKHNDLENVGRTARHHTFFEMLGNFSFGDYFKQDAIKFAWEFLTSTLKLPKEHLWISVYEEDDEAAKLWRENTDVNPNRVLKFGKEDNFWAMGDTGPCGPCSEIYYYLGDKVDRQSEQELRTSDGLYMEIWNLVFMQFNRDPSGNLNPLPKPSVDTGMGLERISVVKQGVQANYDIDLLRGIIRFTEKLSGKAYLGKDYTPRDLEKDPQYATDVALRVIADHVRASAFLVADGVSPGSDGRGYVLRRLIRRACRHGRVLGFKDAFLYQVAGELTSLMGETYPELKASKEKIQKLISAEEEKFIVTLDTGLHILSRAVSSVKEKSSKIIPGNVAFELHDTYGFPLDMTEDIVRGQGLSVDSDGFSVAMEEQRERSRAARANETNQILQRSCKPLPSKFVGYDFNQYESEVLGVFGEKGELKVAKAGENIAIITAETPFYAESGGQLADTGSITSNSASLKVLDVQKLGGNSIVHVCQVEEGELTPNSRVRLEIAEGRRRRLRVNHSATHLVHLALREVLGTHVKQAGSRVSDQTLRFDFNHYESISESQLAEIERVANQIALENHQVVTEVLPLEEAKRSGAVALFGEKYGESVRVVQIGPRSRELCGGTHTSRSGDIGIISVFSEGGISAGVRRVEAYAGFGAQNFAAEQKHLVRFLGDMLKVTPQELPEKIRKLVDRNRDLERELNRAEQSLNASQGEDLSTKARTLADGRKILTSVLDQATPKQLREMADNLRQRLGSSCIALGSVSEGKAILLTAVSQDLLPRYHAGQLLGEISKVVGGRGGGKADLAQAGGGDPDKLSQALERFNELVSS